MLKMLSNPSSSPAYRRPQAAELAARLAEPRRFVQVVAGPRQVGKSTLVAQAVEALPIPVRMASADEPALRGPDWIAAQWEAARLEAGPSGGVLVIDEVQKSAGWSESVKRLWDEDTRSGRRLRVVLLGSAPLLVEHGLSASLAGRFEVKLRADDIALLVAAEKHPGGPSDAALNVMLRDAEAAVATARRRIGEHEREMP